MDFASLAAKSTSNELAGGKQRQREQKRMSGARRKSLEHSPANATINPILHLNLIELLAITLHPCKEPSCKCQSTVQ